MFFNGAQAATYREGGISSVLIFDGLGDAECAEANGAIWTLDQYASDPIAHPNCVRTAGPVFKAEAGNVDA